MGEKSGFKVIGGILMTVGVLSLLMLVSLGASSGGMTVTYDDGTECVPLDNRVPSQACIPPSWFSLLMGLFGAVSLVYGGTGIALYRGKRSRAVFWMAVALSLVMLLLYPVGTVLGGINVYLLYSNREEFTS